MITCPKCGHQNEEWAVNCADCRNNLRRAHGNPPVDEKAADELGEVLNQLDLPVTDDETATGEPLDGEALFHLLMHPRATAAEVAALDVEALTKKVAYRRKRKVAPGAVDPALTNVQIAEAILDYVRSAPPDMLAGQVARATSGEALLHETGIVRSSHGSWPIRIARVAVLAAGLVSFFGPWGWSGGAVESGWGFALLMTLMTFGLFGLLYAGLLLYCMSVLKADDREWVFWGSRLALVLWLVLGTPMILGTNIRLWHLTVTWGAWLFLAVVALANSVEGISLIRWGREMSNKPWRVVGIVWMCLGLVLVPLVISCTEPRSKLHAEELLTQYQAYRRTFDRTDLAEAYLAEAHLPEIELRDADLRGADLHRANLRQANLHQANLSGADLSESVLHSAILERAYLNKADLSGADLSRARLRDANLREANLSQADISDANLSRASLHGADLSGANLTGAEVTAEQLAQAKTLEGATLPDSTVHE